MPSFQSSASTHHWSDQPVCRTPGIWKHRLAARSHSFDISLLPFWILKLGFAAYVEFEVWSLSVYFCIYRMIASARVCTPSFSKMLFTCACTVQTLIPRIVEIVLSVCPAPR